MRSAITRPPQDLYLIAFDLLHLNGHDLRDMPLKDRREILQALIPAGRRIQFSQALPGTGDAIYHLACEANLERHRLEAAGQHLSQRSDIGMA